VIHVEHICKRLQIGSWVLRSCLIVQCASLAIFAALNFLDERLEQVSLGSMLLMRVDARLTGYRILLPCIAYSLVVSLGLYAMGILIGVRAQRSLKHLFTFTATIALTLALFTAWQRISWDGRCYRMKDCTESLQVICDALRKDWPTGDTNHELLDSIMAYPQWNPTTLILLTPRPINRHFYIAAIDRSQSGALRFELSSGFETIWLEHHNAPLIDDEFTNGIQQHFVRQHSVSLSRNWYLVRYR
jgi:hypothetical protein